MNGAVTLDCAGYGALAAILKRAFDQASKGKGKERHANDLPFHQQPMQTIAGQFGIGFLLGQATKKAEESQILAPDRGVAELLGAINYLAGAVIFMESKQPPAGADDGLEFPLGTEFLVGKPVAGLQTDGVGGNPSLADGWFRHDSGIRPVALGAVVDIKCRDGSQYWNQSAAGRRWSHQGSEGDIMEYRVVKHG